MIKKTSDTDKKDTSVRTKVKNSSVKTNVKKATTSAQKVSDDKVLDKQVPVKDNVDPMEKVMAIKAKNDKKKASKMARKMKNKPDTKNEKGNKAAENNQRKIIKEKAQKVAEKKFVADAEVGETKKCCLFCSGNCKDGLLAAWVRAYKNMFNFKGRTSRYEFWGFNLVNFLFACVLVSALLFAIEKFSQTSLYMGSLATLFLFILISIIAYLSLNVRRLHDTGNTAWNGFFRPIVFSILCIMASVVLVFYCINQSGNNLQSESIFAVVALSLFTFISFLCLLFYSTKTMIYSCFFEEDVDNEFGEANYTEKLFVHKAFQYAVWYYVLIAVINLLTEIASKFIGVYLGQY